jgi:hypothetical protein
MFRSPQLAAAAGVQWLASISLCPPPHFIEKDLTELPGTSSGCCSSPVPRTFFLDDPPKLRTMLSSVSESSSSIINGSSSSNVHPQSAVTRYECKWGWPLWSTHPAELQIRSRCDDSDCDCHLPQFQADYSLPVSHERIVASSSSPPVRTVSAPRSGHDAVLKSLYIRVLFF